MPRKRPRKNRNPKQKSNTPTSPSSSASSRTSSRNDQSNNPRFVDFERILNCCIDALAKIQCDDKNLTKLCSRDAGNRPDNVRLLNIIGNIVQELGRTDAHERGLGRYSNNEDTEQFEKVMAEVEDPNTMDSTKLTVEVHKEENTGNEEVMAQVNDSDMMDSSKLTPEMNKENTDNSETNLFTQFGPSRASPVESEGSSSHYWYLMTDNDSLDMVSTEDEQLLQDAGEVFKDNKDFEKDIQGLVSDMADIILNYLPQKLKQEKTYICQDIVRAVTQVASNVTVKEALVEASLDTNEEEH